MPTLRKESKKLLQDWYIFLRDSLTIGIWGEKICFVWELELDGGQCPPYAKSLKKLLQDWYIFLRDSLTIGIWAEKICFV